MVRLRSLVLVSLFLAFQVVLSASVYKPKRLSVRPAIFEIEKFMTAKETDMFVDLMERRLQKHDPNEPAIVRLTDQDHEDAAIANITKRAMDLLVDLSAQNARAGALATTRINPHGAERLVAERTDQYAYTHFHNERSTAFPRVATLRIFLESADSGHLLWPYLTKKGSDAWHWDENLKDYRAYQCKKRAKPKEDSLFNYTQTAMQVCLCKDLLRIKPRRGMAVLVFNSVPNGDLDPLAGFIQCPVLEDAVYSVALHVQGDAPAANIALKNPEEGGQKARKKKKKKKTKKDAGSKGEL